MSEDRYQAALRQLVEKGAALAIRKEAATKVFEAACIAGDGRESDQVREQLHMMLDQELDNKAEVIALAKVFA